MSDYSYCETIPWPTEPDTMVDRKITLRLTIEDPVPGVTYSLQDRKNVPVGSVVASDKALSFDVPVDLKPGPQLGGTFVRREGPLRRFVYIAIGEQAGAAGSEWSRRAKIDVHDIPAGLMNELPAGKVIECTLPGRAKDGSPACATLRPLADWQVRGEQ